MADQTVSRLVIDVTTDAAGVSSGFDQISGDAKRMGADVEDAGKRTARGLSVTADSTDELASKSSQATGALGALSAGFELVGLDKYAVGLQSASMATDFFSGVGDSLNLVLQSTKVQSALARVASIRQAAASRVVAAATRAQAIAQRGLNLVMRANPIGLIITAIVVLVGLFVLAYKRSSEFRSIVQAVGRAGRAAVGWIVDRVRDLVDWVKDKLPGGFRAVKAAAELYFRLATAPIRAVIGVVKDLIDLAKNKVGAAFGSFQSKVVGVGNAIKRPFDAVLGVVKDIIDFVKHIKIPHVPGFGRVVPDFGRTTVVDAGSSGSGTGAGVGYYGPSGQVVYVQTTVQGAVDPMGTASVVNRAQRKAARRLGLVGI